MTTWSAQDLISAITLAVTGFYFSWRMRGYVDKLKKPPSSAARQNEGGDGGVRSEKEDPNGN